MNALADLPAVDLAAPGPRVDLWYFFYGDAGAAHWAGYEALLSEDERRRHQAFHFEEGKRQFLATRALVRTVLSKYADVPPEAWRFGEGEHGKPFLTGPKLSLPLHFNLTNTRGLVACAVSRDFPQLGVDAEWLLRQNELDAVAQHSFSPLEVAALRAQPESARRARFFSYWTLKESYIKARGLGLALPLAQFSFLLDQGPEIGIAFDPRLGDDAARWRFGLFSASPEHFLAVGAEVGAPGGGAPLQLAASRCVP